MMPHTLNDLPALDVVSCLQKSIRRAEEELAMQCACELSMTSKAYFTMCVNRLRIIMHEDIDVVGNPHLIPAIETTIQQAAALRDDPKKLSKVRMLLGTVIRIMCRAPKSREGDHFHVAVGRPVVEGNPPELPDWTYDKHTSRGKKMGRGLDHFREESTKLVPEPEPDSYKERAFAIWAAE